MPDTAHETRLRIGDAVSFPGPDGTLHGHIVQIRDRDRFARVIDSGERLWRVQKARLTPSGRPRRRVVVTPHDDARAEFRVDDAVVFDRGGQAVPGRIVKLNPTRAHVLSGGQRWNVPYALLRPAGAPHHHDTSDRLHSVAAMARGLMDSHGLQDWTLAFVESRRLLGNCRYSDRLIRISRAHALDDPDPDVRDTVLHEIAHAIAGRAAGHGPAWQAVARRIGATPRATRRDHRPR